MILRKRNPVSWMGEKISSSGRKICGKDIYRFVCINDRCKLLNEKKKEISTATKKPIGCRLNISLILRILKVAIVSICLREGGGGRRILRLWLVPNWANFVVFTKCLLSRNFFQPHLSDLQGEESFWWHSARRPISNTRAMATKELCHLNREKKCSAFFA